MKYFKDPATGQLHAYETDGSQDAYIPSHLRPITEQEAAALAEANKPALTTEQVKKLRQKAYTIEADPLFFKTQRGEATVEEWKAKIEEIKARFPMPA